MTVVAGDAWLLSPEYFGSGWSNCNDSKISRTPWYYVHIV